MQGVFLGLAGNRPLSIKPMGMFDKRLKLLPQDHQAQAAAPASALLYPSRQAPRGRK